jgi:hypothetical protein
MRHIVSLSGGTASAVAAGRVLERYGRENVTLWFADTSWEDEDLYRFLGDLESYWKVPIHRFKDGRTPLQVAEDHYIIPNQRRAPCSYDLKIKPFLNFIKGMPRPLTVHLGLDFTEQHRMTRPKEEYEKMPGVTVDSPLMWEPVALPPHRRVTEAWGIETPRLYRMGFPHNNCGGRCIRQGFKEWQRLKHTFPGRFSEVANWEQLQRAKGGKRANYAIARDRRGGEVKPLTLHEIANVMGEQLPLGVAAESNEDIISCFCDY